MLEFPIHTHRFLPPGFLQDYWQQRPCVLRQAFPAWTSPLSAEELAGLACESEFESRLVSEHAETPQWRVEHGPFDEQRFLSLPERDWTLLVQDVDKHIPEVAELLESFRFVPDWRLDDIMISYAVENGSVGPHWDDYDVFLIQASGRRRWSLDTRPIAVGNVVPGLDLRIMENFETDMEWILEPGDVLYLPPRIGHWGVALEPCMTYSVGYRAPDGITLASRAFDHWLESAPLDNPRFTDPGRNTVQEPYALGAADLESLLALTRRWLEPDQGFLESAILAQLTEPKPGLDPVPMPERPTDWLERSWYRHPASRVLYHRHADGSFVIAVGGVSQVLEAVDQALIDHLCASEAITGHQLASGCQSQSCRSFIEQLILEGHLEPDCIED